MLWNIIFLITFDLVRSQCTEENPVLTPYSALRFINESSGNDTIPKAEWQFWVDIPINDTLVSIEFVNASDPAMNLYQPYIDWGMEHWVCFSEWLTELQAAIPQAYFDFLGPFYFSSEHGGCEEFIMDDPKSNDTVCYRRYLLEEKHWDEVQDGLMLWFLLEEKNDGIFEYDLKSFVDVTYLDYSEDGVESTTTIATTSKTQPVSADQLEFYMNVVVPELEARVLSFRTAPPNDGVSTMTFTVELYNDLESNWTMNLIDSPWLETDSGAFDLDSTVVTNVGLENTGELSRLYEVSVDFDPCVVDETVFLTLKKPLRYKAVYFYATSELEFQLQSLCAAQNNLGQLSALSSIDLFVDSSLSVASSEFFLGEQVYGSVDFVVFAPLEDVTIQTATFTQDSVATDITSNIVVEDTTPTNYHFSFFLTDFATGSISGSAATLTIAFVLNYENTSRRRLYSASLSDTKSLRHSLSIRDSCHYIDNGEITYVGALQDVPCQYYGTMVQVCQDDLQWHTINTDECSYLPPISEGAALCFGVGTFILSYFAFMAHASNKKD